MLNFNLGQTYICTETKMKYWTVGKEYPVQLRTGMNPCIVDDEGVAWYSDAYEMYATFKLKKKIKGGNEMLNVKEGQTYVCKRDKLAWWTLGKEYTVQKFSNGVLYITDDDGRNWYLPNDNLMNQVFKVKEKTFKLKGKTFDLNNLTINELDEYVDLQQALELAKNELDDFIERMSK